jgi:hypothetical protein
MSKNDNLQWLLGAFAARGSELSESEKKILADTVLHGTNPQLPFPSYSVTVNYNKTVNQLVKDGKYDWVSNNFSDSHFTVNKKGEEQAEIFIVTIDRRMSTEAITKMINDLVIPLRHANAKEELALGAQYPDLQREGPIAALGSTWRDSDGGLMAPYLNGDGSYRDLGLIDVDGDWYSGWRFACVRK